MSQRFDSNMVKLKAPLVLRAAEVAAVTNQAEHSPMVAYL